MDDLIEIELGFLDVLDLMLLGLRVKSRRVVVEHHFESKIARAHPADVPLLPRLPEVITSREYEAKSPGRHNRLECYKRLDGIWFTAVIAIADEGEEEDPNIVVTFHRISRRKMKNRIKVGRAKKAPGWTG